MDLFDDRLFQLGLLVLGLTLGISAVALFVQAQRMQKVSRRIDDLVSQRRRVVMSSAGSRMLKGANITESLDQIGEAVSKIGLVRYTIDEVPKNLSQ